jgi:hypothetical protein
MAHKIRIYDVNTNEDVTSQDMYFIGLDNQVYKLDDCDCVTVDRSVYWKFDMIEVKR